MAAFGQALTVETAIQQLVWAHTHAPEGPRKVALEYVTTSGRAIQVGKSDACGLACGGAGCCYFFGRKGGRQTGREGGHVMGGLF